MACERYREALVDMAAGGPAPEGIEAHLVSCEGCRRELATLRRALAAADSEMAGLRAMEPSAELAASIRQTVRERETSPALRPGWTWPAVAASAALTLALVLFVGREWSPHPGTAEVTPQPGGGGTRAAEPVPETETSPPPGGNHRGRPGLASESGPSHARARSGGQEVPAGSRGSARRAISPDIIVPPGEAEALLRFAADLQRRTVPPDSLLVRDLAAPLREPKAVEIEPLEIVPLDPAETSGTD